MAQTEQDRIKRQLNYYLAKNIDTLKNEFYGENGIWSKYHAFTERFKLEKNEVCCIKNLNNPNSEPLDLDTYCLGLDHKDPSHSGENNFGAFSWWVEFYLKDLGSVGGTSSGAHGIYFGKSYYQNSENKEIKKDDNISPENKFINDTYYWIKKKLGLSTDKGSPEDFGCKPQEVVLNKIYYLFKMQMKREDDAATSDNSQNNEDELYPLIPIFKIKDEILTMLDPNLKDASWEQKSAKVYKIFNGSLNDDVKNLFNDKAPTESVNDLKNNENPQDRNNKPFQILLLWLFLLGCFRKTRRFIKKD